MSRALLVVDVQKDFCEGGSLAVQGGVAAAHRISEYLAGDHGYDVIVATRDHHVDPGTHFSERPDFVDSWPPHCVVGTEGADFPEELTFRDFDDVFDKGEYAPAYSGFEGVNDNGTKLPDWLAEHGVDSVDVVGIATDYCVRYTALDAVAAGLDARVLLDYTAAVAPERIESTYAAWKAAGVTVEGDLRVPAEDG